MGSGVEESGDEQGLAADDGLMERGVSEFVGADEEEFDDREMPGADGEVEGGVSGKESADRLEMSVRVGGEEVPRFVVFEVVGPEH